MSFQDVVGCEKESEIVGRALPSSQGKALDNTGR